MNASEQTQVATDARSLVMENGATVSDWLGTAATAASVAAMYLNDVRNGVAGYGRILSARDHLTQAIEELDAIGARLLAEEARAAEQVSS